MIDSSKNKHNIQLEEFIREWEEKHWLVVHGAVFVLFHFSSFLFIHLHSSTEQFTWKQGAR